MDHSRRDLDGFTGRGRLPDAMQELQKRIVTEYLPDSGYEWAKATDIEFFEPARGGKPVPSLASRDKTLRYPLAPLHISCGEGEGSDMLQLYPYDRNAAVLYAHQWAYGRNPRFYDYEYLGGDCTNFASQCIFAGSGVMNFTPTYGWYYIDANRKAPAWTGVPYLYNFLTRDNFSIGPLAKPCQLKDLLPGDLIQLSFKGEEFQHSPIVVSVGYPVTPETVLIAAHSYDADNRPLSTYEYRMIRFLHIIGVMRP